MFNNVQTNQVFDSVMMILAIIFSNIGARYIILDIDKRYAKYFGHDKMRYVYIFSMAYLGSRNIYLSLLVALVYSFV
jgi:hypothetical protein